MDTYLAFKVDVVTDRGTRDGVLPLAQLFQRYNIPATFYFSLGPDNIGKALGALLSKNLLGSIVRSQFKGISGLRSLINGAALSAPVIGQRNEGVLKQVQDMGFEVGLHAFDAVSWSKYIHELSLNEVAEAFDQGLIEYERIFGEPTKTTAAPGWQANACSLEANAHAGLLYASDTRGSVPFFPRSDRKTFRTLQIPTTLPSLSETLALKKANFLNMGSYYAELLSHETRNVMSLSADLEGISSLNSIEDIIKQSQQKNTQFFNLGEWALELDKRKDKIPFARLELQKVKGSSGKMSCQGAFV